jgi:hypothetical protein
MATPGWKNDGVRDQLKLGAKEKAVKVASLTASTAWVSGLDAQRLHLPRGRFL